MLPPTTENKNSILRLPNEILRLCFEQVAQLDHQLAIGLDYYNRRYGPIKERKRLGPHQGQINVEGQYSLALTCRRFYHLVVPILYTTVHIDAHYFNQEWALQKDLFFKIIDNKPILQTYIRDLKIQWDDLCMNDEIIKTLVKLPNLERLGLDMLDLDPGEVDLEISFRDLRAKAEVIKRLLEWPRNLHTFDVDHMTYDAYDWDQMEPDPAYRWDHDKLTDVLLPQRQSLRVLNLGWLGYTLNQNTFSTWDYPQLQTLTLCITYEDPTPEACLRWLSPSLQTLVLNLQYNSVQQGIYSMLNKRQMGVVKMVGKCARKIKAGAGRGGSNLDRIGLQVFVDGSEVNRDREPKFLPSNYDSKHLLVSALEKLQKYGFRSFCIGPSGTEYTAEDIRGFWNWIHE
ncbi:hypothetical protein FVEN_g964 [Fusarium venenatum]|nr:hypothetical protein FVEN_g964 [Fusarium venenatum]